MSSVLPIEINLDSVPKSVSPKIKTCLKALGWVVLLSLMSSPRLSQGGIARFIRLDDLFFPLTFLFVLLCLPVYLKSLDIVLPFVFLGLFNVYVAIFLDLSNWVPSNILLPFKLLPAAKVFQYLTYFFLYYVIFKIIRTPEEYNRTLLFLVLATLPNALYGIYQTVTLQFTGLYAVGSLFEYSPTLGGAAFYFAAILAAIALCTPQKGWIVHLFYFAMFVVQSSLAIGTGSRAASLNIMIFAGLLWVQLKRYKLLTLGVMGILLIIFLSSVDYTKYLGTALRISILMSAVDVNESGGRLTAWSNFSRWFDQQVADHPILAVTGAGSGSTYMYYDVVANAADSQLLSVYLSGGLLGSMLYFLSMCWIFFKVGTHLFRHCRRLFPVFTSLFLSFMIFSVSQEVFILSKTGGLFWTVLGIIVGSGDNPFFRRPKTTEATLALEKV